MISGALDPISFLHSSMTAVAVVHSIADPASCSA
jgi:hypothetical protein